MTAPSSDVDSIGNLSCSLRSVVPSSGQQPLVVFLLLVAMPLAPSNVDVALARMCSRFARMRKVQEGTASLAETNLALGNRGTPLHFAAGTLAMFFGDVHVFARSC